MSTIRLLGVLCVLCGSGLWARAQETPSPGAPEYLAHGQTLLAEGRVAEARPYFEYALNLDPGLGEAWLWLGKAAYADRRWVDALAAFENAARLAPGRKEVLPLIQELRYRQTPYQFSDDSATVIARARKRNLPILLLFLAEEDRCPPCGEYRRLITGMEDLRPVLHQFAGAAVDAAWSEGRAATYGVVQTPTLVLVGASGKVLGRLEGVQKPEAISDFFDRTWGKR